MRQITNATLALLLLAVGSGGCGRDAAAWWQFPVERREFSQHTPPSPPFAETNAPSADVEVSVESPRQGGMTSHQFAALQECLARAIAPHATTLTWRELKPLLRPSFALPRHQCFSVAPEKYLDNSRLRTVREL